jgi:hypothetical protein
MVRGAEQDRVATIQWCASVLQLHDVINDATWSIAALRLAPTVRLTPHSISQRNPFR